MSYSVPDCFDCAHLTDAAIGFLKCKAFPAGIPREIIYGERDHTTPYPDAENREDNGFLFTPQKEARVNG